MSTTTVPECWIARPSRSSFTRPWPIGQPTGALLKCCRVGPHGRTGIQQGSTRTVFVRVGCAAMLQLIKSRRQEAIPSLSPAAHAKCNSNNRSEATNATSSAVVNHSGAVRSCGCYWRSTTREGMGTSARRSVGLGGPRSRVCPGQEPWISVLLLRRKASALRRRRRSGALAIVRTPLGLSSKTEFDFCPKTPRARNCCNSVASTGNL